MSETGFIGLDFLKISMLGLNKSAEMVVVSNSWGCRVVREIARFGSEADRWLCS